jgi:signal transduction histidine kinase
VIVPLYFREHQLGFALLEVGTCEGRVYETLRGEISSSLYGALLLRERQQAEKALVEAQEQLVRREKLAVLGQLAATVSHEIRNPLATIHVSATALERKLRNKGLGVERSIDRIQRNITRCDKIISEMLDYARVSDLKLQPVELDGWMNRLLDEQDLPAEITLVREIASGVTVELDPERFRRVLINLIENARQAMQTLRSSDAERILTVQTKADADSLTIAIGDTGPGISPEVMPRIFEPLFSTKDFGAGLGLSVVKGIVEQHGGMIHVASSDGKGTKVSIQLPLHRKENAAL